MKFTYIIISCFFCLCCSSQKQKIKITSFESIALKYLKEIPIDSRKAFYLEDKSVDIKIYINYEKKNIYSVEADFKTISSLNKPADFSSFDFKGIKYSYFLFDKNDNKTLKNIEFFQEEYDSVSPFYQYSTSHYPIWKIKLYKNGEIKIIDKKYVN